MTFVGIESQLKIDLEELTGKTIFVDNIHFHSSRLDSYKREEIARRNNAITLINGATLKSFVSDKLFKIERPVKVFGEEIRLAPGGQGDCLDWSEASFKNPLLDENKNIIGDMDGNVIAFTIDLFHTFTNQREIILYSLVKTRFISLKKAKDYLKRVDDFVFNFKHTVNAFKRQEVTRLEGEKAYKIHQIEDYEKSMSTRRDELRSTIMRIHALGTIKEIKESEIREEIANAKKLPFVKKIRMGKNRLTVEFIDVWFKIKGKRRLRIGPYSVIIHKEGGFHILHNKLKELHHSQHLHAGSEGAVCLGNFEKLTKNILDGQFEVFLVAIWDFLNFPRDHHSFIKLENFLKSVELANKGKYDEIEGDWNTTDYVYADINTLKVKSNGDFTIDLLPRSRMVNKVEDEVPMVTSTGGYWNATLAPLLDEDEDDMEEDDE